MVQWTFERSGWDACRPDVTALTVSDIHCYASDDFMVWNVMPEAIRLNALHAHEVLHTASIIAEMFERHVKHHPYTQANMALRKAAEQLSDQLHDFYQLAGQEPSG